MRSGPWWHGTGSQRRYFQAEERSKYMHTICVPFAVLVIFEIDYSFQMCLHNRCSPLKRASNTRFASILSCSARLCTVSSTCRRHTDSACQVIELHAWLACEGRAIGNLHRLYNARVFRDGFVWFWLFIPILEGISNLNNDEFLFAFVDQFGSTWHE